MSPDLRESFRTHETEPAPPTRLTGDVLVARGRRSLRRRRLAGYGSAGTAACAAVVAGVLLVGGGGVGTADTTPPANDAASPAASPEAERDDVTAEYDAALRDHLAEAFPDAEVELKPFGRVGNAIISWDEGTTGTVDHEYTGLELGGDEGGSSIRLPGDDLATGLSISVRSAEGFTSGEGPFSPDTAGHTPPEYLLTCEDGSDSTASGIPADALLDMTCTEATGPGGERIIHHTVIGTGEDGDVMRREVTALLYREDGSAVTVTAWLTAPDSTGLGDALPGLTVEDAAAIALALPATPPV
ncbi:hypothetical protein LX16_0232 [Stackebrandtia albiflava]|uniref:Uncharacterized protein n=1 Tax=Stackebrandtia albiflava TaxID=406432 RepID=A0A562V9Q3_9ACTN|nr:hypothetical protein [Stackebrandtia albiflava]TWJ14547.1 hypothetical protein LX16_0232 [Stackebrandtia albiflava]